VFIVITGCDEACVCCSVNAVLCTTQFRLHQKQTRSVLLLPWCCAFSVAADATVAAHTEPQRSDGGALSKVLLRVCSCGTLLRLQRCVHKPHGPCIQCWQQRALHAITLRAALKQEWETQSAANGRLIGEPTGGSLC
jgi:hypothetical protein